MNKIFDMFSGNKKDSLNTNQQVGSGAIHNDNIKITNSVPLKTTTGLVSGGIYSYGGYTCSMCGAYVPASVLTHFCNANNFVYEYNEYRRLLAQSKEINDKLEAAVEKFDRTLDRFNVLIGTLLQPKPAKKKATKKRA